MSSNTAMILPLLGPFALFLACWALFRMCIRFGTLSVKTTRIKCVPPRGLVLHAKRERFIRYVDGLPQHATTD
jgi:hypothetical protein